MRHVVHISSLNRFLRLFEGVNIVFLFVDLVMRIRFESRGVSGNLGNVCIHIRLVVPRSRPILYDKISRKVQGLGGKRCRAAGHVCTFSPSAYKIIFLLL